MKTQESKSKIKGFKFPERHKKQRIVHSKSQLRKTMKALVFQFQTQDGQKHERENFSS